MTYHHRTGGTSNQLSLIILRSIRTSSTRCQTLAQSHSLLSSVQKHA